MKNFWLNMLTAIVLLVILAIVLEDCHRQNDCESSGGVYVSSHWHMYGRCVGSHEAAP